jgi:hypothetical protein
VFVEAIDSRRVIVSLWGESRWAQNLRAPAPDARLRFGNRLEPIEAHEMPNDDRKTAVMLALCRQNASSFARLNFKVDPKRVTLEQAHELAARYPVFRIETRRLRAASG